MPIKYLIQPSNKLNGEITPPGDKSISHRAIMLGAIADGITQVNGLLTGHDVLATRDAFKALGVQFEQQDDRLRIHGVGLHGLKPPTHPLNLGNSGTSMRLLAGLLAAQPFDSVLIGDQSLSKRPMRRIVEPLLTMGAKIAATAADTPPLTIQGNPALHGIRYVLPVASAQVKSCLLLAGLYADNEMTIIEPAPSRDHTERMLRAFGIQLQQKHNQVNLQSAQKLQGTQIDVPADISSAAFFIVGAIIARDSQLLIKNVGINPTRIGIIHILREMGARIQLQNQRNYGAEPVADLLVQSSELIGIDIPLEQVPLAIDEFPAILIAAACAKGKTRLHGAKELRVKESDRIAAMAEGFARLGVKTMTYPDGIDIENENGSFKGGHINSYGDHRIAMSFAIAALRARQPIEISDCDNVATSFPNFVKLAVQAGLRIIESKAA